MSQEQHHDYTGVFIFQLCVQAATCAQEFLLSEKSDAHKCLLTSCTQVDVRSNSLDENIGQLFIPIIEKPHFESFSGIPVKKIRDNAITEIDVKGVEGRKLEACGGVILAHCLKSNSSVTVVDASSNNLGVEGGKALAECLKSNTTITQVC